MTTPMWLSCSLLFFNTAAQNVKLFFIVLFCFLAVVFVSVMSDLLKVSPHVFRLLVMTVHDSDRGQMTLIHPFC